MQGLFKRTRRYVLVVRTDNYYVHLTGNILINNIFFIFKKNADTDRG